MRLIGPSRHQYRRAVVVANRLGHDGDSISTQAYSFPDQYAAAHPTMGFQDISVGGATIGPADGSTANSLNARRPTALAWNPRVYSVHIGANDCIGYASAQAWYDALKLYFAPFLTGGRRVVICSILPRMSYDTAGNAAFETRRNACNVLLRAGEGTDFYALADWDTTLMGTQATALDTTYYADTIHPTQAGHNILSPVYATVINGAFGIANEVAPFDFTAVTGATLSTDYESSVVTISRLFRTETRAYSVSSGTSVRKNGGSYVLNGSGTVANGDTLQIKATSSSSNSTETLPSLTIGGQTSSFSITTVAGVSSRDWVPTDLGSKLKLWTKSDTLTEADGVQITTWADNSGNSVAVTGAGSTKPKASTASALNGMKVVSFMAASAAQNRFTLPTTHISSRTGTAGSATFFMTKMAADPGVSGAAGPPIAKFGTSGQSQSFNNPDGNIYDDYCATVRKTVGNPTPSLTDWHIAGFRSKTADWRFHINGTTMFSTTSNVFVASSTPAIGFNNLQGPMTGYMTEIIDCDDFLTTAEVEKIEGYLAWKWARTDLLPSGHTYKSAAPTIAA